MLLVQVYTLKTSDLKKTMKIKAILPMRNHETQRAAWRELE
jgi:hypothetical protein